MSLTESGRAQPVVTAHAEQRPRPWRDRDQLRRLGAWLAVGVVLALVTYPGNGSNTELTAGLRGGLLSPRLPICLGVGAAIWGLIVFRDSVGARVQTAVAPVRSALDGVRRYRAVGWAVALVVLVVAVVYPHSLSLFWQAVLVQQIGIYMLLAMGLNVVVGFAGLLDLGYIAFFAIGAYTDAYFTGALPVAPPVTLNPFWVVPIAIVIALLAGVILGAPTLRLRGDYLAIVTLGFGEIIYIVANNADPVTNGPRGVILRRPLSAFGYEFGSQDYIRFWYLMLAFIIVVWFLFRRLEDSRVGRAWTAIREDEVAAAAAGVATVKYKLMAFAIGASTSGVAGVLFAENVNFVAPINFVLLYSILALVFVIFGGMGSIPGVVLGAGVLQWLPNVLRDRVPSQDRILYFGGLLIVMMIFRPQGLIPSRRRAREIALAEHGVGDADAMSEPTGGAVR